jgi:prepilin-type N-terminal cleavage/methylation domain-containing protein
MMKAKWTLAKEMENAIGGAGVFQHVLRRRAAECAPYQGALSRAFTLIELMVVVGIIAVIMSISIPFMYHELHPDSLKKVTKELMELCKDARAYAVLNNVETDLVIHRELRQIDIQPGSRGIQPSAQNGLFSPGVSGQAWRMADQQPSSGASGGMNAIKLPDTVIIEGVGINGDDWTEDEIARVRFYPTGTSDEFTIILLSSSGERRNVWLDAATGFPDFEVDSQKFKAK